jgi:hypothetical protein
VSVKEFKNCLRASFAPATVPLELQEDGQFCSMVQQNFLRESCHACRTEREEKRSADSYSMCMRAANSVEKHSADSYRMCMRAADSVAWPPWLLATRIRKKEGQSTWLMTEPSQAVTDAVE